MDIKVHRGINQIGGNIIEIHSGTTRILFDVGLDLDPENNLSLPKIEGLFDSKEFDAIFISHYHSDHLGLVYGVNQDIPIYIGEKGYGIVQASNRYLQKADFNVTGYLKHKVAIQIGDIKVTPYLCDHSAYDSYMLFAETATENVLYTGDFRANGRKPSDWLFNELPKKVDVLICEGTTLSRKGYVAQTEKSLENEVLTLIKSHSGPVFVLQSSMNIDRIVTMYRAAIQSDRLFLVDTYLAEITSSIRNGIPNPLDFERVRVFLLHRLDGKSIRYALYNRYGRNKIGKETIAKSNFVMCIRTSMLEYIESLCNKMSFENGLLIYSFWTGYLNKPEVQYFVDRCKQMGLELVILHVSGHADENTLVRLIDKVNPTRIIPVHTENADWFSNRYPEKIVA